MRKKRNQNIIHSTYLRLNDGQGSQGAAAVGIVHLGSTLEEAGMEVEDVTGVSLATGRTPEQERHLTVGDGLLGQVVKDDEGVFAVVPEVLAEGAARVRRQVLQRSGVGSGGRDDDRVPHGV